MNVKKLLGFGILAFLIIGVSAEIGLRARFFFTDLNVYDPDGLFHYPAHTRVMPLKEFTTNAYGFLGDELSQPKAPNTYRVFLLGASELTVPAIPRKIHDVLQTAYPDKKIEVCTTGIPRYMSWHARKLFENHLLKLQPDCLILHLNINDNVYDANPKLVGAPPVGLFNCRDFSHSVLLGMAKEFVGKRIGITPNFTTYRSAAFFEENLRAIIDQAQAHQIKVVLLKPPLSSATQDPKLLKVIQMSEKGMRHYWGNTPSALKATEAHNAVLDKLAAAYHLPLGSPMTALKPDSSYFQDLAHYTPIGAECWAVYTADLLIKNKVLARK